MKLAQMLLRRRRWVVALVQGGLIFCSLIFAWLLRFEFRLPNLALLLTAAPVLIVIRLSVMPFFNLMHGWWRYTGVSDAVDVLKAVITSSAIFFLVFRMALGFTAFPLSVYASEALLAFTLLAGVRLVSRMIVESVRVQATCKNLLLVGAGHAAQMLIRETKQVATGYSVVGCVDDDPLKKGLKILGVPVLGTIDQLGEIVAKHEIDEALIAIPSATSSQMRRFVQICEETAVPFRTIPGLTELIVGRASLEQVREVRLEDLLGRKPVKLDLASVRAQIQNKVIMVTGACGSIGSELCRQILRYSPASLLCVDQDETGIFYLQRELQGQCESRQTVFCVADVGDAELMRKLFLRYEVQIVFHAAAYKHVPVMEANVEQAVNNNVFKLLSLLEVAQSSGCDSFVMISSDKAVNPSNVMGCTKRVGELILAAWPSNAMRCVSVRFGNVLGSSGSVVPLFQEQLRQNQPLTVTHPDIKRFFMTLPEAVSLVLQASAVGKHGNILVLDMGEPVRILDLAHTLIRLSGKSKTNVEIKFTGLRPGEKLFEELFYAGEKVLPTACDKVKCTKSVLLSWPELKRRLEALSAAMFIDGPAPIRAKLKQIVPEFHNTEADSAELTDRIPLPSAEASVSKTTGSRVQAPSLSRSTPQPAGAAGLGGGSD